MSQTSIDAMLPYMTTVYGNPSSLHSVGRLKGRLAAGKPMAQCLGCEGDHFHVRRLEADNQAIISAARLGEKRARSTLFPLLF